MKLTLTFAFVFLLPTFTAAARWRDGIQSFIEESCISCHDNDTETRLDLTSLGYDLEDEQVFRTWVQVFDRAADESPTTRSGFDRAGHAWGDHYWASIFAQGL